VPDVTLVTIKGKVINTLIATHVIIAANMAGVEE
jgi:hypothetical protein